MIEIIPLLPGITLRVCRDTRFKQGCLSFQLIRQMKAEEAALNALLPSVWLRGTKNCPDLRSITEYLDELYGASVAPLVRRVGDYQTTGLYCGFMDDRFALPGDQVLKPMLQFLEELLLDSPLENGAFLPAFVESEKKNLISTIESELNDKRTYSISRLLRIMCREDTFGIPRLGDVEAVAAITPQGLSDHAREILKTSPIEIFYVGSEDAAQVVALLKPLVTKLGPRSNGLLPQTPFLTCENTEETEMMDVAQAKLCMGFVTSITNRCEDFAAMQLLNVIYGSGMTSKLFVNVREKMSLCYSIGSSYYGTKGLLVVSAGIDADKAQLTQEEALRQLDACRNGQISQQELKSAQEALLSSLRSTHDAPGSIEGFYSTAYLSSLRFTHGEYMEAVETVTIEDVVRCANSLQLHTTYLLKGGDA